jgi:membrane fusion protein (multidrug efflux system)
MRLAKKDGGDKGAAVVTLEFAPADLAQVERRALSRWLPVSGALQPVRQATVKAKVSGDVRQITVREGETVQTGQVLARIDTADLDAKLIERIGALESAKAQLALAEKTRTTNQTLLKQNFISQNAFDNSESSYNVAQGSVKSAEAQVQIARNALRDAVAISPLTGIVAKRHVQPGEKVAFDSPLVTIVDLKDMELQAAVPATDVPELAIGKTVELVIDGFGDRRFSGRVERINPATEPGTRSFLVYVGIPNADGALRGGMFATGRIALAASAALPTLPSTAVRVEAGQAIVWMLEDGKLVKRNVVIGARDDAAGRVEIRTALPAGAPILGARFDNLKDGAPAIVKAPSTAPVPASAPTSGTTQVAG